MCGRFFRHDVSWEEYHSALSILSVPDSEPPEPAYNIAPTQSVPIIRIETDHDSPEEGATIISPAMWGLVPHWWKKPLSEKKFSTFNAKSEEAADKASFRAALKYRHCLIPASGYYEWSSHKGKKRPYAIGLQNHRWFFFAGLWDRVWIDGSPLDSFTILTTAANDTLAPLHKRMPIIVGREHYQDWLNLNREADEIVFAASPMANTHYWPVGASVGNVRNHGAQLIEEATL
ncbi:MAG: SOS response-associated peptidase [Pseudomonadota bacterium]